MTMRKLREGPTQDTASQMTRTTHSLINAWRGFECFFLRYMQMDGVIKYLSELLGQPFFFTGSGSSGGQTSRPKLIPPGSHRLCLCVWRRAVHEVKRLIGRRPAIHGEPLYNMAPFSAIVRAATIAVFWQTAHKSSVCTRVIDVEVKCGDVCSPRLWLQAAN